MSGKDLYNQTIVVRFNGTDTFYINDTFHVSFPNISVDYPLGEMQIRNRLWTNWNEGPLKLWQTQLHFAMFCASSACRVSSEHLDYKKHSMVRSLYRFQVHYDVRRAFKRLQVLLPHDAGLTLLIILTPMKKFSKICED